MLRCHAMLRVVPFIMLLRILFTARCRRRRDLSSSAGVASQGSDLVSNSTIYFILSYSQSSRFTKVIISLDGVRSVKIYASKT